MCRLPERWLALSLREYLEPLATDGGQRIAWIDAVENKVHRTSTCIRVIQVVVGNQQSAQSRSAVCFSGYEQHSCVPPFATLNRLDDALLARSLSLCGDILGRSLQMASNVVLG